MELLFENIKLKQDCKMLISLVKRLGFTHRELAESHREDFALGKGIEERSREYANYEDIMKLLSHKINEA